MDLLKAINADEVVVRVELEYFSYCWKIWVSPWLFGFCGRVAICELGDYAFVIKDEGNKGRKYQIIVEVRKRRMAVMK